MLGNSLRARVLLGGCTVKSANSGCIPHFSAVPLISIFLLLFVMATELSAFVQSVESAGKDETFDEFVIAGLAANHITVCVCVASLSCAWLPGAADRCWISCTIASASLPN